MPITDEFTARLQSQLDARTSTSAASTAGPSASAHQPSAEPSRPSPDGPDDFSQRLASLAAASNSGTKPRQEAQAGDGASAGPAAEQPRDAAPETDTEPAGDGEYVVRKIDCLSRIAAEFGHLPETIWTDPANERLREVRPNPEILLPGDRLHVPPLRPKQEPGAAETRNRFRRHGTPSSITLVLKHNDQPRANEPYRLEIEGQVFEGVTDAQGQIIRPIPPGATRGRLRVGNDKREHDIQIGRLNPIEAVSGVQQRLNNLGFVCGEADGVVGPRTRQALTAFQEKAGLERTGRADDPTRQRLVAEHGS